MLAGLGLLIDRFGRYQFCVVETAHAELEARVVDATLSPFDRVDALNALAWAIRFQDVVRAQSLADAARSLARDHGYQLGQARAARTMAMTISDDSGLRAMWGLAEEAKRLFDEAGDLHGRAGSRDFLASIHEHVGDLTGGLALALDALSLARELGDPARQGYALSSVGGILAASGEIDTAIEHLKEAEALFQGIDDLAGVGTIVSRLCKVFKKAGRVEEALDYAERCRELGELRDDGLMSFTALETMAQLEADRGHDEAAERLYHEAFACLPDPLGRTVMGSSARIAAARLMMKRGALEEAERELTDVLAGIAGNSVSFVDESEAHAALAEVCEGRKRYEVALSHLRQSQKLREEMFGRDANNKLAQVEARAAMETAQKDAEIHRLKFVELQAMQAKLLEGEKMALLGKLAAGTSHELNTPLGVLRSNTQLAAQATQRLVALVQGGGELGPRGDKLAATIETCLRGTEDAIDRIAGIAASFRRFTQLDQAERRGFDLREGLDSAIALLEPTVPKGVVLERHFTGEPRVEGWPREVNFAFMTVLQNAVEAIEGPGRVIAETRVTGDEVVVCVRDTGRGMTPEQVGRLFDVTWSQQGARTQMRLGLSAAYATMKKHGGHLDVESVPGEGTTVTFRFPSRRAGPR